jgi:hypothetical protein
MAKQQSIRREMHSIAQGLVCIMGSFRPNNTGAIDNTLNTGTKGSSPFSVARTGTGEYTITLDQTWASLVSATASIAMSTPTDLQPQWGAIDVASAKTLVLQALAGATPTDIASNAANRVHFCLWVKRTARQP